MAVGDAMLTGMSHAQVPCKGSVASTLHNIANAMESDPYIVSTTDACGFFMHGCQWSQPYEKQPNKLQCVTTRRLG